MFYGSLAQFNHFISLLVKMYRVICTILTIGTYSTHSVLNCLYVQINFELPIRVKYQIIVKLVSSKKYAIC